MILHTPTDIELWHQVRQGDRLACEALYRRHMRGLYAAIYKWTEDRSDAEDILQEVFLDVWDKRQQTHIRGQVFSYLYSVARNKVFDYIKDKKVNERQLQSWYQVLNETMTEPILPEEPSTPADSLIAAELDQLPPQMKQVYHLRFREEKSIPEIADQLMVSPYTIKNHLQKIRKRLHTAALRATSFLFSLVLYFVQLY